MNPADQPWCLSQTFASTTQEQTSLWICFLPFPLAVAKLATLVEGVRNAWGDKHMELEMRDLVEDLKRGLCSLPFPLNFPGEKHEFSPSTHRA